MVSTDTNKRYTDFFKRFSLMCLTTIVTAALLAVPTSGEAQLTKQEQRCIGALTKDGGKLSKTVSKLQQKCLKDAANGKLTGTTDACISDDEKGKVAKTEARTLSDETKHCFDGTGFVTATGAQTNLSAKNQTDQLGRDLLGSTLHDAVQVDKSNAKCQQKVQKALDKVLATKLKSYTKCAKNVARDELTINLAPFENCLLALPLDAKVVKAITKLTDARAKTCDTLPLNTIFPGNCAAAGTPALFDTCIDTAAECRACTTIAGMNGLATDCDLFDNGVADLSCASAAPSCGDGNVDPGEECDPGAEPTCCSATCTNNSDGLSCDDGTFCNGADTCSSGACVSPGDPCSGGAECNAVCDEVGDTCFDPAATPCTDDGNVCTDDVCDGAGSCSHPGNTDPCNDGNFCNGADTCDGAGGCTVSAGDPCPGADGDGDCAESCDEGADNCLAPDTIGSGCDDGLFCSGADTCDGAGACVGAGDPCAGADGDGDCAESCDEGADNCLAPDAAASACDDGLFCTVTDTCDGAGTCGGTGDPCPGPDGDGNCSESCDEGADNCSANDAAASACDDGLFCTATDTCDGGGSCLGAGDPCPGADGDGDCAESCDEGADNCLAPDTGGSACSDGTFCNGTETCDGAGSCGASTGDPCSGPDGDGDCAESCDEGADNCLAPDTGGSSCTDGSFCNGTETCDGAGSCGASTGDPCTGPDGDGNCAESCDEGADNCLAPDTGGSACTDGTFCNGTETCDGAGSCGASTGDPCSGPDGDGDCAESCDEGADNCLAPDTIGSSCTDGAFCNGTETCDGAGSCAASTGDPCPGADGDGDCAESCDESADNCLASDPAASACTDGAFCNGTETCDGAGSCGASTGDPCPGADGDGNCAESCDEGADNCLAPDTGGSACDDGLFCTDVDTCNGSGTCGGAGDPCPGPDGDGNCAESCDEGADNCLAPDTGGSACTDGAFCNGTETCDGAGSCGASTGDPCPGADGDGNCAETCDEGADNCLGNDPAASACTDGAFCNGTETCNGAGSCGSSTGDPCAGVDGDGNCAESCDEGADNCLANDPNGSACDSGAVGMNDNCDVTGDTCSSGTCVNSDPAQVPEQCYTAGDEDCDGFADTADLDADSQCQANGIQTCTCSDACLVGRVIPASSGSTSLAGLTPLTGEGSVSTTITGTNPGIASRTTFTYTLSSIPGNLDMWWGFTGNAGHNDDFGGSPDVSQFRFAASDSNALSGGDFISEGPHTTNGATGGTLTESSRVDGLPVAVAISCSASTATSLEIRKTSGPASTWAAWGTGSTFPTSAMSGGLGTEANSFLLNTRLLPVTGSGTLVTDVNLQLGGTAIDAAFDACHTPSAGFGYGSNFTAAFYGSYRNANVCP